MIRADVTVTQLKSEHGTTYMNVHNELGGGVGVWGFIDEHLYLIVSGNNFTLVQFDDEAWAKEELQKLVEAWSADFWIRLKDLIDFLYQRREGLFTNITSDELVKRWSCK